MTKFLAAMHKELLLLIRDRSGLLVLFVMPAVLVLVITLVQENAMKTMGESDTEILFIDNDRGMVGRQMEAALSDAKGVRLIKTLNGSTPDKKTALKAVAGGDYQVCLLIPEGLTPAFKAKARRSAMQSLSMEEKPAAQPAAVPELEVYFDPTVMGGVRSSVQHLMRLMALQMEMQETLRQLAELLPAQLQQTLEKSLGPMAEGMMPKDAIALNTEAASASIITIRSSSAQGAAAVKAPNAVQQNVPAWSLFGIFFIVLPMAGSFIKERLCGVEQRILVLPVSYLTIVAGKVCAYMLICLIQFGLILLIGKTLLPMLGTPVFELGTAPLAALLVALSAILAATGYGILLGTLVKSYEQASMFGPISIVIAAALGGVMVPVYAMPAPMQTISVLSPLAWAQNAFLELFVRGGSFQTILPQCALLQSFAIACIGIACIVFFRRIR